jgi:hypothetical protein
VKPLQPRTSRFGKKSRLLPNKAGLNDLGKSGRTIVDYSKQVPTNPADNPSPLLINLMRKPK